MITIPYTLSRETKWKTRLGQFVGWLANGTMKPLLKPCEAARSRKGALFSSEIEIYEKYADDPLEELSQGSVILV